MDLLTAPERRVEAVPTLITPAEVRVGAVRVLSRRALFLVLAVSVPLTAAVIAHHEAWADEAQSWLLARDASLFQLWTRLLHYEGTTGLWQTMLHALIRAGLPYTAINIVGGILGAGAAALILWRSPFPWAVSAALPFTYFLCYQYVVIARSYDLLPVLTFACAICFQKASERPLLFTSLLCLMAGVSVHGMVLAASIGITALASRREWQPMLQYAAGFGVIAALLAFTAWPAADGTFVSGLNFSPVHFVHVLGRAFGAAFTGEEISSLAVVALTIPLLWQGGTLLFFALSCGMLCTVDAAVYSQVWHFGVLFLAWIFALWIAYVRLSAVPRLAARGLSTIALTTVMLVQCYWTWCAVRYDWSNPYSGSRAAAQGIAQLGLEHRRTYAIGYACVAIQPYFSRNIFINWNDRRTEAYWDWSNHNHVNKDVVRLRELRPEYVIIGYKNQFERSIWTESVARSGYHKIRHFEGNSFWQDQIFEPESFDLYRSDFGR